MARPLKGAVVEDTRRGEPTYALRFSALARIVHEMAAAPVVGAAELSA